MTVRSRCSPAPGRRGADSTGSGTVAVALLLLAGCSSTTQRRTPRVPILSALVERRSVPFEIDATGTVESIQSAQLVAQVGGMVTRIAFREGDDVARARC